MATDHDQRFKSLLQVFFTDFLALFFSVWAKRLDAAHVEWLQQEVFPDPPEGLRRALDLVGKVATVESVPGQPDQFLALVHIEIEWPDRAKPLRPRMFHSYVYWLGVALSALMRIPKDRVAWLGAEALRRIGGAPLTEQQRFLLAECVQAYLPLDEEQHGEFNKLIVTEPYRGVQAMNTTWFEKGIEKGIEKGVDRGQRELICEVLEDAFGTLSAAARERVQRLSLEELRQLGKAIRRATSLRDLGLEDQGSGGNGR